MKEVLKHEKGVGLAAPQIGISKRVIIVDTGEEFFALLNPVVVEKSKEKVRTKEGCLSVKGVWFEVERAKRVVVRAVNKEGQKLEIEAENILSVIVQHEIDHLNGKLFIDGAKFFPKIKMIISHLFQKYYAKKPR